VEQNVRPPSCESTLKLQRGIFKGLSEDGGRAVFSKKTSAPLSLMTTYQMSPISAEST
jgi:hypothetical protein